MRNNYRLTVHLTNVKKVRRDTGESNIDSKTKKRIFESKEICYNTLSFYCKTKQECLQKLSWVRGHNTIAKGKNPKKRQKLDKEMWNISFVN